MNIINKLMIHPRMQLIEVDQLHGWLRLIMSIPYCDQSVSKNMIGKSKLRIFCMKSINYTIDSAPRMLLIAHIKNFFNSFMRSAI